MNTTGKLILAGPATSFWPQIISLDSQLFPHPWSRPLWEDLDWSQHILMSWSAAETLWGFGLFSLVAGDDTAHLLKILMLPEHRGKGETVLFWREMAFELKAKGAKSVYLEVEILNIRALSFYRKIGFKSLRQVKGFYSNGADAVIMQLIL